MWMNDILFSVSAVILLMNRTVRRSVTRIGMANRGGRRMKISSVMSKDVQLIKPDDTLRSAAALMKKIDAGLLQILAGCSILYRLALPISVRSQ